MAEAIRVKTETRYRQLYSDLKNFVLGDSHELFFICTCLGYKAKKRKLLSGVKSDRERFWSDTITPKEWACYKAIILKESNFDLKAIQDDKATLQIIEEYANGGMEILIEECLKDYVIAKDGALQLDKSSSKELPRHFLYHLFSQIEEKVGDTE